MKDEEIDISLLLKTKDFNALTAAERAFVLSELGSREKYQNLQRQIIAFGALQDNFPPESIRKNVLDSFDTFHDSEKRKFGLWIPNRKWHRQPAIYTAAAASILIAIFLILPIGGEKLNRESIAENKSSKTENAKINPKSTDSTTTLESIDPKAIDPNGNKDSTKGERKRKQIADSQQDKQIALDKDQVDMTALKKKPLKKFSSTQQGAITQETAESIEPELQIPMETESENQHLPATMVSKENESMRYQELSKANAADAQKRTKLSKDALKLEEAQNIQSKSNERFNEAPEIDKASFFRISSPLPNQYVAY